MKRDQGLELFVFSYLSFYFCGEFFRADHASRFGLITNVF